MCQIDILLNDDDDDTIEVYKFLEKAQTLKIKSSRKTFSS